MKNLLLFAGFVSLAGCNAYTVKNNSQVNVKAGETIIKPGYCKEFSDSFFGLFGVYPIAITKEDNSPLSESAEEEYFTGHYVIKEDGSIIEVNEGCDPDDNPTEGEQKTIPKPTPKPTPKPKSKQNNAQDADTAAKEEQTRNAGDETTKGNKPEGEEI